MLAVLLGPIKIAAHLGQALETTGELAVQFGRRILQLFLTNLSQAQDEHCDSKLPAVAAAAEIHPNRRLGFAMFDPQIQKKMNDDYTA